jgi:predicted membrane protein
MANRGMLIVGGVLIALGVLFFIGSVFQINIGALCFPVFLIVVGVLIAFRPNLSGRGGPSNVVLIGDVRRRDQWEVDDAEYWVGVADVDLDMTRAFIPEGETVFHFYGFVSDIEVRLPDDVGFAFEGSGFVVNTNLMGRKTENILAPVQVKSQGYDQAARRVRFEAIGFVVEMKVKQS